MNSKIYLLVAGVLLAAGPVSASTFNGSVGSEPTALIAAAPTASPAAGTYTAAQSVALAAPAANSIHYVTDESELSCFSGNVYTDPIVVSASQTIRAIACYGSEPTVASSAVSFSYIITIPTPAGGGNGPIAGSLPSGGGGGGGSGGTPTGNTTALPGGGDTGSGTGDTGSTSGTGSTDTGTPGGTTGPGTAGSQGGGGGNGSPELGLGGTGLSGATTTEQLAAAAAALGLGSTTASSSQLAAAGSLFGTIAPYLWWILLLLILGGSWWYYWYLGDEH